MTALPRRTVYSISYDTRIISIEIVSDKETGYFFFQAEDGIRDSVASRGLGDVYKSQLRWSRGRSERTARSHRVDGVGACE